MSPETIPAKKASVPLIRGEIFNRLTPLQGEPKGMAALGQKGLPVGPVAFMSAGSREQDMKDQFEKNEAELRSSSEVSADEQDEG